MRTLKLYDPARRGTWLDQLGPGEYPVFLRDAKTWAERNTDGQPLRQGEASVCLVFGGLEEAEQYCERKVRELPHLRCDIYNHHGLAKPPLRTFGEKGWNPTPKTLLLLACVSLVVSVPLFWLDWRRGGELILPSIIGIGFIAAGIRFLFWGLGVLDDKRAQLKRNS